MTTTDPIILIPPTHEQSVYSFHVEEKLLTRFLEFLEQKGLTPWRPPVNLEKENEDAESLVQVDIETEATHAMLEDLKAEFLKTD